LIIEKDYYVPEALRIIAATTSIIRHQQHQPSKAARAADAASPAQLADLS
jgi:hypothetical protein